MGNSAYLDLVRSVRERLETTQARDYSGLSVADVARNEGLDPDEAMWLLRPDVAVLTEIPVTGDHDDIDALALPEHRRPEIDAPISAMLGHLARLARGRLLAWLGRRFRPSAS